MGHLNGLQAATYGRQFCQALILMAMVLALTHARGPVRIWKSLTLSIAAALALIGLAAWRLHPNGPVITRVVNGVTTTIPVTTNVSGGFYVSCGLALAVFLFSLRQTRLSFRAQYPRAAPARYVILDFDIIIKRLRWVMLAVMIFDLVITLLGQPATFWKNPATANEGDPIVYAVMQRGLPMLYLISIVYGLGCVALVSVLPRRFGGVLLLVLTLWHYFGASTWLDYTFGYTYGAVWHALVLAVLVVILSTRNASNHELCEESDRESSTGIPK